MFDVHIYGANWKVEEKEQKDEWLVKESTEGVQYSHFERTSLWFSLLID